MFPHLSLLVFSFFPFPLLCFPLPFRTLYPTLDSVMCTGYIHHGTADGMYVSCTPLCHRSHPVRHSNAPITLAFTPFRRVDVTPRVHE
ncbi:hypothetical protein C8R45DRAFT_1028419 [Mycena sanguinolenta]|nr:hypothetical protein C8R45DRAFT_1028419 [Mycena sanguinolenta]